MIKESETTRAIVLQTADALASDAQQLRHAHEWATMGTAGEIPRLRMGKRCVKPQRVLNGSE